MSPYSSLHAAGMLAACGDKTPDTSNPSSGDTSGTTRCDIKVGNFTYKSYATSLGNNWNPHTWETSGDDAIQDYLSMPLCTISIKDSENGVYQWVFEMATSITDVTKDHKDDLTKYKVTLPNGKTANDVESGYVFEIKLNEKAKWEDGTPINADTYLLHETASRFQDEKLPCQPLHFRRICSCRRRGLL